MTRGLIAGCALTDRDVERCDKATALERLDLYRQQRAIGGRQCLMCAVTADPADVVFETPQAQVRLDRFGCTEGHLMVVPREHVEHAPEMSWEAYAHLQWLAHRASALLQAELRPLRVFIAALGAPKALAQSYPHFHIHVIPVYHEDERARPAHVLSWSNGVTTYSNAYSERLTAHLARAWKSPLPEVIMSKSSSAVGSVAADSTRGRAGLLPAFHLRARRLAAGFLGLFATGACSSGGTTPSLVTPPVEPTFVTPDDTVTAPEIFIGQINKPHPTLASAKQEEPARPIVTGTLLATSDGAHVFASDVDRDAVFKVALPSRRVTRIDVAAGQQPGQLAEVMVDGEVRVFAVLRAAGALLAIDPATDATQSYPVCASPRGLTYDAGAGKLFVACESGQLQTVDPATGTIERTLELVPDLRDVQVLGENLLVSRYRSAEVLTVSPDGSVTSKAKPDIMPGCAEPAVMHRMVVRGSSVHLAHQVDTTGTLETFEGGYGAGAGCSVGPVEPVVIVTDDVARVNAERPGVAHIGSQTALQRSTTRLAPDGESFSVTGDHALFGMPDRSGPLDLAVSSTGRVAVTFTGDSLWPEGNALVTLEMREEDGYRSWQYVEHATGGTLTSVAFDADGKWVTQSREPAQLSFEDGSILVLDSRSAANTGLDLFYVNTGRGLSCAGCHPEGDEDGRTWAFPQGMRRTQTLGGGVLSRAPFHWDGEMPEMDTLMREVMMTRMAFGTDVTDEQVGILGRWLDAIPASNPMLRAGDASLGEDRAAAIESGRQLFSDATVGCSSCHSGAEYTDNKVYDVGTGGNFYTPTLLGIGLRNAFMHDGCARTLTERFGICGGGDAHGKTSHLSTQQVSELVAFMETL